MYKTLIEGSFENIQGSFENVEKIKVNRLPKDPYIIQDLLSKGPNIIVNNPSNQPCMPSKEACTPSK